MTSPTKQDIQQLSINTIRTLAMDAVEKAKSGHPGTPMALAPVAYTLWQEFLRYDPMDPTWPNRDRFVLSAGHASMLLYALLHLADVKAVGAEYEMPGQPAVKLDDIIHFRQLGSKTPGHPEYHLTTGVEATTGPLGQGVADSVGMAIAGKWFADRFNRQGYELFNFNVYALASDGDMMEGISSEAASLAGHLKLSNLCWIYDNNRISIEGKTDLAFSEDTAERFRAYQWNVQTVDDVNDLRKPHGAFDTFQKKRDRPTLILLHSHIGYGAPHKQDTAEAHGEPLGEDEVRAAKRTYGWPEDAKFLVPEEVREHFREGIGKRGKKLRESWIALLDSYRREYPDSASELDLIWSHGLPKDWDCELPVFHADPKGLATRASSGQVLNAIARNVPWLIGGSADLAPSTKTTLKFEGAGNFEAGQYGGRNFHFGVREHSMGAILNGMALSSLRSYGSTFLIFSDYERPAVRLSAIMELPVIHIFTHDSIALGEDGPTHQPIGQLASLRAIPGLMVLRPADANEVVECWKIIMELKRQPAALVLTRQPVPTIDRGRYGSAEGVKRGAYVIADHQKPTPDVLLLSTGSEVSLCLNAFEKLAEEGIHARVISMTSWELFEKQSPEYRERVLPTAVKARVSVEAATIFGWARYVGTTGTSIGMNSFGASAPVKDVLQHFGFTVERVTQAAKEQMEKNR